MREPVGWQSVTEEVGAKRREQALARRLVGINGQTEAVNGHPEAGGPNGHVTEDDPEAESPETEVVDAE